MDFIFVIRRTTIGIFQLTKWKYEYFKRIYVFPYFPSPILLFIENTKHLQIMFIINKEYTIYIPTESLICLVKASQSNKI